MHTAPAATGILLERDFSVSFDNQMAIAQALPRDMNAILHLLAGWPLLESVDGSGACKVSTRWLDMLIMVSSYICLTLEVMQLEPGRAIIKSVGREDHLADSSCDHLDYSIIKAFSLAQLVLFSWDLGNKFSSDLHLMPRHMQHSCD